MAGSFLWMLRKRLEIWISVTYSSHYKVYNSTGKARRCKLKYQDWEKTEDKNYRIIYKPIA
jgi:hypothetical protein